MADETTPPMARPRVAAGALFFDQQGRLLLVKPTYKQRWDIPGGYVEPGETPRDACAREIREELGISTTVGRLLAVDWAPTTTEGDKVLFVFDGGQLTNDELGAISLPSDELAEFALFDNASRGAALTDRLERRVSSAMHARDDGFIVYLEHGSPPTVAGATPDTDGTQGPLSSAELHVP